MPLTCQFAMEGVRVRSIRAHGFAGVREHAVSTVLPAAVTQRGARSVRLHDLRHTHATLALAAGVPTRVISGRLGHSAMAVTTDIYQHAIPDLEADFAERIASLVVPGTSLTATS